MRKARVFVKGVETGILEELSSNNYHFIYHVDYKGPPVSLTMPIEIKEFNYNQFPPFSRRFIARRHSTGNLITAI